MVTRNHVALLLLLCLSACGGPSEEDLLHLPHQIAEDLREGRYDDAVEHLSREFQYSGMGSHEIAISLPRVRNMREWNPHILKVEVLPSEGDAHHLLILGVYCRGSLTETTPARMRPFKVLAQVGERDGRFRILSIEYEE